MLEILLKMRQWKSGKWGDFKMEIMDVIKYNGKAGCLRMEISG